MKPLRLLIVAQRFWPLSGPVELAVGDLAEGLKTLGHKVEIVTAKWDKSWPARMLVRETPVHRIARPLLGPWGNFRYLRALNRFVDTAIDENRMFDGVFIFGLGQEFESLLRLFQNRELDTPIVVRVDPNLNPYRRWPTKSTKHAIQCLNKAESIVADSDLTRHSLTSQDVDQDLIKVIHDGVAPVNSRPGDITKSRRSKALQIEARRTLSDAHPILAIQPDTPLVVSAAGMMNENGLVDLVAAWPMVIEVFSDAKLWILGDGERGQQVWDAITSNELVHSVIMPGYFDDLEPIFQAANLYVHPCRTDIACSGLTRAMASGLCPVATLGAFSSKFVTKNETGIVTVPGNSSALAEAIIHGLKSPELRSRLGSKAQQNVCNQLSVVEQARSYAKLMTKQTDPVIQIAQ